MKTEELRRSFLNFFASKEHTEVGSASLVPAGDPTLLFTNAGMVPFKDCFLGAEKRAYVRATTCQKCLRISGKHNDLENVGRTARHHTFFEMLGNFSFGDYFKAEAIGFAWEYLTEVIGLPKERLWATVYTDDDEAEKLWYSETDLAKGRVLRFGEKDNFWAMGDTGPCGPCSEVFYYLGDNVSGQSEEEFRSTDGLYVEIWNLVFMQFNRDATGTLTPLPKPSVDTGMGLERLAAIQQGVASNYDTDILRGLIAFTEKLSGEKYDGGDYTERDVEKDKQYACDVAFRVIADHVRAAVFLIADEVNPSSDGRGYVLRRLIRRACRHGRVLGFDKAFLYKVSGGLVDIMGEAYPELGEHAQKIQKIIKSEEEKFLTTLDTGISVLTKELSRLAEAGLQELSGEIAFQLHDTYGFPLDMTEDMIRSRGLAVDTQGFQREMEAQRERSRNSRAKDTDLILERNVKTLPTEFVGYEFSEYESKVLGIFNASGELKKAKEGEEVAVVVEQTPFYAESGGQIGDTGFLASKNGALDVVDTQKTASGTIVHVCQVKEGEIVAGESVRLEIEGRRRAELRLHHSATHLLHLALREVLGDHVKQAGSRVSHQNLRFDFNHFEAIKTSELEEIERIVNEEIRANYEVETELLSLEDAKKTGATALFGEKYGEMVRVVQIGPHSRELCGGTHANRSGDIGFLTIASEGGVSAGVRRVEAYAGRAAFGASIRQKQMLNSLASLLRTKESELDIRVTRLLEQTHELEKKIEKLDQSALSSHGSELTEQAVKTADGRKVVASLIQDASPKQLREMADDLKQRLGSGCIALGSVQDGKVILLTAITDDLTNKFHAGNLMKEISSITGGRGGGRADMAQSGGGDPTKVNLALERFQELVR